MEYRFFDSLGTEPESVPLSLSHKYRRRIYEKTGSWDLAVPAPVFIWLLPEMPLYQEVLKPFLEAEFDKKLAARGMTRAEWEAGAEERRQAFEEQMQQWREEAWATLDEDIRQREEAEAKRLAESAEKFKRELIEEHGGKWGYRRHRLSRWAKHIFQGTPQYMWRGWITLEGGSSVQYWNDYSKKLRRILFFLQERAVQPFKWKAVHPILLRLSFAYRVEWAYKCVDNAWIDIMFDAPFEKQLASDELALKAIDDLFRYSREDYSDEYTAPYQEKLEKITSWAGEGFDRLMEQKKEELEARIAQAEIEEKQEIADQYVRIAQKRGEPITGDALGGKH